MSFFLGGGRPGALHVAPTPPQKIGPDQILPCRPRPCRNKPRSLPPFLRSRGIFISFLEGRCTSHGPSSVVPGDIGIGGGLGRRRVHRKWTRRRPQGQRGLAAVARGRRRRPTPSGALLCRVHPRDGAGVEERGARRGRAACRRCRGRHGKRVAERHGCCGCGRGGSVSSHCRRAVRGPASVFLPAGVSCVVSVVVVVVAGWLVAAAICCCCVCVGWFGRVNCVRVCVAW